MKKQEQKLKSTDVQQLNPFDLLKFTFHRKSFFRDYANLHATDREEVERRVGVVLGFVSPQVLAEEIRLCFKAAILTDRPTYYFNVYVIDLVELYLSDANFDSRSQDIKEGDHLVSDSTPLITYEWVLNSKVLDSYQRYLLFEYLVLGYSVKDLAKRRYCEPRTIYNHLNSIIDELSTVV